jgi:hypothetical protein
LAVFGFEDFRFVFVVAILNIPLFPEKAAAGTPPPRIDLSRHF